MTLLIAVSDVAADEELISSARALAAAAGWDVRAIHVSEGESSKDCGTLEEVELVKLEGDAAEELTKLVGQADVQCLAVGLCTVAQPVIGHVARAMLDAFSIPLFLVRPGMRPLSGLRRLLVPLEGTPSTSAAMRFADENLCTPDHEIIMLHVATGKVPAEAGSMAAPRFVDQEQYEWSDWQDEFSMRFSQCGEGCRHRVSMRVGDPMEIIVEEAQTGEAELIVLSWKGKFAKGHGRIVHSLLERAPCPLLIVPADAVDGQLSQRCRSDD